MAEVLLFHHALGLTAGCRAFADRLRGAGHVVHTPDLYAGRTFADLADGIAHAGSIGVQEIIARGRHAAEILPDDLVYAGFSLGVLPAQTLAQTRPGARGVLLFHSCVPPPMLGAPFPTGLPAQIHLAEGDGIAIEEGDLEAARALAANHPAVRLFLYESDGHLFAEPGQVGFSAAAADLLARRTEVFLSSLT